MTQDENTPTLCPDLASAPNLYPAGDALENFDRKESALAAYEEAIQLSPYEASFHVHKAQVLEQLGRLAEAQRAYEEAHRLGYNG
jgi:Flp pilus assembly protein TadD